MMNAQRSMSYVTWPCCPDPPRVGVFCVFVASWIWLVLAPYLPPMSLWLPGSFDVDPSSRTRCLSFEQKKEIIDWQRPEPGQQDFTLQLGVTSTSWTMDLGSLWIKSILTTKPTLQIPMDKDRLQERAALSSPYHLSWASLRFAIGRLFSGQPLPHPRLVLVRHRRYSLSIATALSSIGKPNKKQ